MTSILKRGFTLIELLIVVAIIAILAAIAVPNFLEAQVRSKVSRVKADMRTAATGLESYAVDHTSYPFDGANWNGSTTLTPGAAYNYWYLPSEMTTPVAYLNTNVFIDPFRKHIAPTNYQFNNIRYRNIRSTWGDQFDGTLVAAGPNSMWFEDVLLEYGAWALNSSGPDETYGPTGFVGISNYPANPYPYDPTNGTISEGDVIRTQKSSDGYVNSGQ